MASNYWLSNVVYQGTVPTTVMFANNSRSAGYITSYHRSRWWLQPSHAMLTGSERIPIPMAVAVTVGLLFYLVDCLWQRLHGERHLEPSVEAIT